MTPTLPPLYCASHTISGSMPGTDARHDFAARVDAVAAAGFDGLVIHFRDHLRLVQGGADPGAMRDHVARSGLAVPAVEFLADWHDGPGLGSVEQAIETAHLFGAKTLNIGADLAGLNPPLSALKDPFRRLCDVADAAGMTLALEMIAWGRISTLEAACELVALGQGQAGLLLDIWHLAPDGHLALEPLRALDPSLVIGLQINDAVPLAVSPQISLMDATRDRRFPGDGMLDIPGFLAALWPSARACGVTVEVIAPFLAALPLDECATRAAASGRQALHRAAARRQEDAADG